MIQALFTEIKSLEDLISYSSINIPYYQRPYIWSEKSVTILFNDIYNAYRNNQEEYRLGTIILHSEDNILNIVDGQQRLITLGLLLYILDNNSNFMVSESVNDISKKYIKNNYNKLKDIVTNNIKEEDKKIFAEYMKKHCTFAIIITDKLEEAFQFFDSQNSRGKSLAPHDLLKAYHLREMRDTPEHKKEELINQWENVDDKKLIELFEYYLYPTIKWYKGENGLNYNIKKIDIFKGIKENFKYNYARYHIFSHIFVEKYKNELSNISYNLELNQFQLTQPIIAGERFFRYVIYYYNLLENIISRVDKEYIKEEVPESRTGDKYIRQLYISALLFFADRFNIESLEKNYMHIIYKWSYALRLVMQAVYRETVNKYASDKHDRLEEHKSIFKEINNMMKPEDIINTTLMNLDNDKIKCKNDKIINQYNKSLNKEE